MGWSQTLALALRSTLEFYEGGCQEKFLPADGQRKFSSTSRPL